MNRFVVETLESRQFFSTAAPIAVPIPVGPTAAVDVAVRPMAASAMTAGVLSSSALRSALSEGLEATGVPGAVAGVITPEGKLISAAAGVRVKGLAAPVRASDPFHMGSNLKAVTATLAARLVEQGRVRWDTTLVEVAPELQGVVKDRYLSVTLEQLLSHRAAIPDIGDLPQEVLLTVLDFKRDGQAQRARFIPEFLTYDAPNAAGTFQYSNIGYATAGYLIERATGRSYDALLRSEVFKPLRITSAVFASPGSNNPRRADAPRGHTADGAPLLPSEQYIDQPLLAPAGLYSMNIADFAKFASVHLGNTPAGFSAAKPYLTQATLTKLHTPIGGDIPTAVGGPSGEQYALGWSVSLIGGNTVLSHDGSNDYWLSRATLDLSSGTATLFACNQLGDAESPIGDTFIDRVTATITPAVDAIVGPERTRRQTLAALQSATEEARAQSGVPGIITAVLRPDGTLLSAASGVRQNGANVPIETGDSVVIGSCGKAMTSTLAAILVEKGRIRFDSTLTQLFPEVQGLATSPYANVTLENLLAHTGGIQPEFPRDTIGTQFGPGSPTRQRERMLAATVMQTPIGPVGTSSYSNTGYALAGAMLERAAGKPYEALMSQYIFRPLGMTSVRVGAPGSNNPANINAPRGHDASGNPLLPRQQTDPVVESPAGAFCMSVGDWSKFIRAQLGQTVNKVRLLSDAQLAKLQTPNADGEALGWGVLSVEGVGILAHDGTNGAWLARVVVVPATQKALFVVSNQWDPAGTAAADAVTNNAAMRSFLTTP